MTAEQVKQVLQEKCIKAFGTKAVIPWDIERIAQAIVAGAERWHVEVELAMAQGIVECHFGCNPAAKRSRATKNIYNVGNVDNGNNRYFGSYEAGIDVYFRLMAREYCWHGESSTVSVEMMERHDFCRPRGGRYATANSYTQDVARVAREIRKLVSGDIDTNVAKSERKESKGRKK